MTTPPLVTDEDRDDALAGIRRRHRDDDSGRVHLLHSDNPLDVLTYLRERGSSGLAEADGRHDVEDGLILKLWLWWQAERAEMWLLDASEKLKLNRRRVGAVVGITVGQSLVDRLDRKRAMFGYEGVPNAKLYRAGRRDLPAPRTPDGSAAPAARAAAVDAIAGRPGGDLVDDAALRSALGTLLANLDGVPDEAVEDVLLLRRETGRFAEMGVGEFAAALRYAVGDLRGAALPPAGQDALDRILAALRM